MGLTKYALGELLERNTEYNEHLEYGVSDVRGVLNTKEISDTRVSVDTRDLSKFLVVRPGGFIFNHRVHDKLGLGYNTSDNAYIFTNDYVAFYVKPDMAKNVILPDYLYIWYQRSEFDRYMLYKTYGSATLFFNWDNMCELEIELPDIDVQKKFVAIYKAMVANQQSYEQGLDDLVLVYEGYLDRLRSSERFHRIGDFIELVETRNDSLDYGIESVKGVSIEKKFINTKADMQGVSLRPYYIVRPNEFAYVPVTSRNGGKISLAINDSSETYICSSSYVVFRCKDEEMLFPQYLMLFFSRREFNRYARFNSWGSARETFDWNEMCDVEIPIPDIGIQRAIAEIFSVCIARKKVNERLKAQIKDICPVLIRGSLEYGG